MPELRVRILGLLRSTEGSMTEDELSVRIGVSVSRVRAVLGGLADSGEVFRIRYTDDPVDHWRASAPRPFGLADTHGGGVRNAVCSVLRGHDWGLTERQISEAVGARPRTIHPLLERLFLDNSVIRERYKGDPEVYWRAGAILARPSP